MMTTGSRGRHDLGGVFRRGALGGPLLGAALAGLNLPEAAEQHVGERAVHGLAHDDREDQARGTVEGPGGDQQLVVQDEAHRHGRQAGVGVQQGDHGRHVGPADGDNQHHAERQRQHDDDREQEPPTRIDHQQHAGQNGDAQQREVDRVLAFVDDRPGGDDFHQLAGGHQAAGEGQEAQDDFGHQARGVEGRGMAGVLFVGAAELDPQIELGGADQAGSQAAEGVRERGPLRNGRQGDHRQGNARDEAQNQGAGDPPVALKLGQQ